MAPLSQLKVVMGRFSFLSNALERAALKVVTLAFVSTLLFAAVARAQSAEPVISARSPEVLATYSQAPEFRRSIVTLKPALRAQCESLLGAQLRLQQTTDSWKMYSLYEMLDAEKMMTGELVRVRTVTELSTSLPAYTNFRITNRFKDGSIVIADLGTQCGPDPLSVRKGAYFLKCGAFMIGSGLIRTSALNLKSCANVRILKARR